MVRKKKEPKKKILLLVYTGDDNRTAEKISKSVKHDQFRRVRSVRDFQELDTDAYDLLGITGSAYHYCHNRYDVINKFNDLGLTRLEFDDE